MAAVQAVFLKKIPFGNAASGGRICEVWQGTGAIVGGTDTVGGTALTCNFIKTIEFIVGLAPTAAQITSGNVIAAATLWPQTVVASGIYYFMIFGLATP